MFTDVVDFDAATKEICEKNCVLFWIQNSFLQAYAESESGFEVRTLANFGSEVRTSKIPDFVTSLNALPSTFS